MANGTEVAVGYVTILPKMGAGFRSQVEGSVSKAGSASSKAFTASFTGGLSALSVATGTVVASAVSGAVGAVSSSLDAAVSRVDTLNQFPKVMENLGFSGDQARASLDRLSDGIQGLPTALDEIVGNAQTLSLTLGDLERGTDVALALNDGMLTYGASAAYVNNAVFQLNQMISAGSYDMESWRSVMESAPGYLDQVAKACLGAGSSANDLRVALNSGKVTTAQFLDAVVRLDKEGGEGVVAFSEQAKSATGGIATSFANVHTAVVRNLANFIDAVNGADNRIAGFADSVKGIVNDIGAAALPLGDALGGAFAAFTDGFDDAYASARGMAAGLSEALFGSAAVYEEDAAEAGQQGAEELLGTYQALFDQVWNGDWGNGEEARRQAFVDAGYTAEQYDAVQRLVNEHGADYVLTMEDLAGVLGDVTDATSKQQAATKKASNLVKEATTGALTPYIDKMSAVLLGTDRTVDAFDEFGVKVGETVAHTDGLIDDLGQSWDAFWTSVTSGSSLGESIKVASLEFDFPEETRGRISDACDALDRLGTAAADAAAAVKPSALRAWESFTGCLTALAGTAFDSTLSFFTQVADPIADVAGALSSFTSGTLDNVSGVFGAIAEEAPTIGGTVIDAFAQAFEDLAGALVAMEPAASALSGLVTDGLVALVQGLGDNVSGMVQPLKDASGAVRDLAEEGGPKLTAFLEGVDVSGAIGELFDFGQYLTGPDGLGGVVDTFQTETVPKLGEAWDTLTGYFETAGPDGEGYDWGAAIKYDAETAFGAVTIAATTALTVVGDLALALSQFTTGDWGGALESVGGALNSVVDGGLQEVDYLLGTDLYGTVVAVNEQIQAFVDGEQEAADKADEVAQSIEDVEVKGQSLSDLGVAVSDVADSGAAQAVGEVATASGEITSDEAGALLKSFDDLDAQGSATWQVVKDGAVQASGDIDATGMSAEGLTANLDNAARAAQDLGGKLQVIAEYGGKTATFTVDVVTNYVTQGTPASQGIGVLGGSGVSVLPHAAGGVTNGLHVVGEAGPEAIVPLYRGAMEPFALQVAEYMDRGGAWRGGGTVYNVRIDNAHVNETEAINRATGEYILELSRLGAI